MIKYMKIHTRLKMILIFYFIFVVKSIDASTQGMRELMVILMSICVCIYSM